MIVSPTPLLLQPQQQEPRQRPPPLPFRPASRFTATGLGWALLLLCAALLLSPRPASCQSLQWGRTASCPDLRSYTQLHWDMALGHTPAKWLVTEDPDGLADRLVNAVSAFLVALITKRALCIVPAHKFGPQTPMEVAYDAPFIDWTCRQHSSSSGDHHSGGHGGGHSSSPSKDHAGSHSGSSSSSSSGDNSGENSTENYTGNSSSHMGYPWDDDEVLTDTLKWGDLHHKTSAYYRSLILSDLTQRPENNATVWRLWLHRGLSIGLFHNPYHSQELIDLGLRPATAFGCIASYLFRPNRDTLWLVPKPTLSVMTNRRTLKIGIQIRCGDANIKKQLYRSSTGHEEIGDHEFDRIAKPFFECAAALERDLALHTGAAAAHVRWYLMTDTLAVRNKAAARYGPKLLSFNTTAIEYYQAVTDAGFQRTVMEHWLLQQADFHIITQTSGLGRTAAFASLREGNVFTLELATKNPGTVSERVDGRGCSLKDHDGLFQLYDMWSGI